MRDSRFREHPALAAAVSTWAFPRASNRGTFRLASDTAQERRSVANDKSGNHVGDKTAKSTFGAQLRELERIRSKHNGIAVIDEELIPASSARQFPKLSMKSLAGNTVFISEQAGRNAGTLVLLAYRSFADDQITSWREPFCTAFPPTSGVQIFDVAINETFASQTLSGFVQRLQRRSLDRSLHDYYLALNESILTVRQILPSTNSLLGYAILLDRQGRIRFRAAGNANEDAAAKLVRAAKQLIDSERKLPSVISEAVSESEKST